MGAKPAETVRVTIDGVERSVAPGTTVVDAAEQAGIEVPIFCHHPRLEPVGMCRMCLVEVGTPSVDRSTGQVELDEQGQPIIRFFPKLQTGCTTRVSEGMVVRTATNEVAEARRGILEFLLTSHPLDCPVCDKGGECPLQNLTLRYGPGESRFPWAKKFHFAKPVPIGPLIALDRERCVLCARCIRFQDEIAGDHVLGFENRGRGMEIVSFSDPPFSTYFAGNTSDICPVGALTTNDFRFEGRVWEVVPVPGICSHCPVGCNISHDVRHRRILRVMPRANEAVNEIWICDKGRFAHHHAAAEDRLSQPLVRRDGRLVEASWDEALIAVKRGLRGVLDEHGSAAIGGIAGDRLCNEDLYAFNRFMRGVIGTNNVDHMPGIVRDDVLEVAGAAPSTRLTELGKGAVVLVAGLDVEDEAPVLLLNLLTAAHRGAQVILLSGLPQKLERHCLAALRYSYPDAEPLLAALVREVLEGSVAREDGTPTPARALDGATDDLRQALEGYSARSVEGAHPVRAADLTAAAQAIASADDLLVVYGREAVQLGLVPGLAALTVATGHYGRRDNGLIAVGPHANSQGAADMGVLPDRLPGMAALDDPEAREALRSAAWPVEPSGEPGLDAISMLGLDSPIRGMILLGCDPAGDDERWAERLEELDFLVVTELFRTATARSADVVLPALSAAEREGTFTNMLRRVQHTAAAVDRVGDARPDWRILVDLERSMGLQAVHGSPADIMAEIAGVVPAYASVTYEALAARAVRAPLDTVLPFAPSTAARRVSYEGTRYTNQHGEGIEAVVSAASDAAVARLLAWRPGVERSAETRDADRRRAEGRILLVPVTRLFDAGTLIRRSEILRPLVRPPCVEISPFDAAALGLGDGVTGLLSAPGGEHAVEIVVRDGVTPGTALAPRSLGWSPALRTLMDGRASVEITLAQAPPGARPTTTHAVGGVPAEAQAEPRLEAAPSREPELDSELDRKRGR